MTTIAHLSDLHLLEEGHEARTGLANRRLAYLTFGRTKSAAKRRARALKALELARASEADHLVLTGDLTEDGTPEQFEVLAAVLAESRWDPSQVTLIPGNHDGYADAGAFGRALEGPLSPYAPRSRPGEPVELGSAVLVPLSTCCEQSYLLAKGRVRDSEVARAEAACAPDVSAGRAVVLLLHHPPRPRFSPMQWLDGLEGHELVASAMMRHDYLYALHGHAHEATDRAVRAGGPPRVFGAEAVVDSRAPLRLYGARHGRLWPVSCVWTSETTFALAT